MSAQVAPSLTCWGATRTVSGSMHVVEISDRLILLDCGLFQGRRFEAYRRNSQFPFHPNRIAAVLLSHAHIDHCGNLPNLVRQGYRGPIYATQTTVDLAAVMLADSARIQEEEFAWNSRSPTIDGWIDPLYTTLDTARTIGRFSPVEYGHQFEVMPGVRATLSDAGHIPGSAMIHLQISGQRSEVRSQRSDGEQIELHSNPAHCELLTTNCSLTYTGDLGRRGIDIFPQAAPIPAADYLLAECTYGGRRHPPVSATLDELAGTVSRVVSRGGKLLIPAFGLGRIQLVVHYLLQLMDAGRAPRLPIFVDSPLAAAVVEVYRRHAEAFKLDLLGDQSRVRYVQSFMESLALCDRTEPCIIVAAGGMCEGGRIIQHLTKNVEDPNTTIALVSFQAPRTLGRQLLDRPEIVHIMGRDYPLRAEVIHLEGFSSHADHDDLLAHLTPLANSGTKIRLVHGEPAAAEALEADLRARGINDVSHPDVGEKEELVASENNSNCGS